MYSDGSILCGALTFSSMVSRYLAGEL